MGMFARRHKLAAAMSEQPVSRWLIIAMLCLIVSFGLLIQGDVEMPGFVLILGGLIGGGTLLLVGWRRPEIPLYVMVGYLPFSKMLVGDFGGALTALNLTNLLMGLLILTWLTSEGGGKGVRFEPHILHLLIALFIGWAVWSYTYHTYYSTHGYGVNNLNLFKRWLDPVFLYLLFFHMVKDKQTWKTVVIIIMACVVVVGLMSAHEYMGIRDAKLERARVYGITGQPNILGAFFVYYMFLFAGFWLHNIKRPRAWWMLVPFLICFRGIMVTFSRGAYVAFALGLLGIMFFKKKIFFLLAVAAIGFAVLNPWVLPEGIRYRLDSTFVPETEFVDPYGIATPEEQLEKSSGKRIILWRGVVAMIQARPWIGVGLGRFDDRIRFYSPLVSTHLDAHNAYLLTAAEFGIPAVVFLLIALLAMFRIGNVVYRHHPDRFIQATALGFLGGLSGLLMANMFGSRIQTTEVSGYFWILAALMARAHLWTREEMLRKQLAQKGTATDPTAKGRATLATPRSRRLGRMRRVRRLAT